MPGSRTLAAVAGGLCPPANAVSDADLVERFAAGRDEGAFALLVRRHGPTVFGVCRRLLRHDQDAEDAFQAVFLVLARRAGSLRRSEAVGNWLYGVAVNVARKARAARLRRREVGLASGGREPPDPPDNQGAHAPRSPEHRELAELIDRELLALPGKYRAAVVLCDLNGRTVRDAAAEVGCPAKTLGTRLLRGRALLAGRLARRGVVAPTVLTAAVPARLSGSVFPLAAGRAVVPPAVAALTHGAVNTMIPKTVLAVVLVGGVLAAAVLAAEGPEPAAPVAAVARPAPVARPQADPPAWAHMKRVAGDTEASRALFAELTKDRDRAKRLERAATDPGEAAKLYAAEVARLDAAAEKVRQGVAGKAGREADAEWRRAALEAVPAADALAALFLGSFPLPEKAADPAGGGVVVGQPGLFDALGGPQKEAVRKLYTAWLDRRREPPVVVTGLDGVVEGAIPEAASVARRWLADPQAPPAVVGAAAVALGYQGAAAEDLPRLAKLRDDARPYQGFPAPGGKRIEAQVRDAAAAMSLQLRGQKFADYGFPRIYRVAWYYRPTEPPPVLWPRAFPTDEARAAAHKKAWEWLDKQPKPEPAPAPAAESPAWKHFKAVCGDTEASKALFAELTKDPLRAQLFDQAVRDPAEAAKLYAATVAHLGPVGRKAYDEATARPLKDWSGPRKAAREAVSAADVGLVLFLGSFPPPAGAADPGDLHYILTASFYDLVTGPRKEPARKLFAAWLDRRTAPEAVDQGFYAARAAAVREAAPVARRWAADPKANVGVVGHALVVLGNLGTAADLPLLSKFRDDARPDTISSAADENGQPVEGQVRERAAALSLLLRGQDFKTYGFPDARWHPWYGSPDVPADWDAGGFKRAADRDAALKKAWEWLDAQPKPDRK